MFGFADIRGRGIDGAFAPQMAVGYVGHSTAATSRTGAATAGRTASDRGVTFTETSSTGSRSKVEVRDGRIVRQNRKPYAVVF